LNNFNLKRFIQIVVALIIGFACLYFVIIRFNWDQIWLSARNVNFFFFFLGISATLIVCFLVRTIRWKLLLKGENIEIPFIKLYLYSAIAIGLSTVTPFQSGEALKVELLRKHGGKRLSGYAIFFLERIFDLFTIVGLAIFSSGFGLDFGVKKIYLYLIGAFLVIFLSTVVGCLYLIPSEKLQPVKIWFQGNWQKKWNLVLAFGLTLLSWMTIIYGWKLALAFFLININFLQSISLVTLTTLLASLSFVPGAVGVSEISVSTFLSGMGIELSLAQTGAIAIRAYALVILILTLLHWLYLKFIYKKL
jgi:uncharacterized membrane protein YbhN (UPF0104 family)